MLEAKIRFFDVHKCGFYNRDGNLVFCSLPELLSSLKLWATDRRVLNQTRTFEPDAAKDILNTYYCDLSDPDQNEDQVLTLWNEVSNDEGKVLGIQSDQQPGNLDVEETGFRGENIIPGSPSYYWFIPRESVLATVVFSHSSPEKLSMERYLNGFLRSFSQYKILSERREIIGYGRNQRQENVKPEFRATLSKSDSAADDLVRNVNRITRMVRREKFDFQVPDQREVMERLFDRIVGHVPELNQPRTITQDIQYRPSLEELQEIIRNFEVFDERGEIGDLGFWISESGSQRKVMLSGMSISNSIDLELRRDGTNILAASEVCRALSRQRNQLIQPVIENRRHAREQDAIGKIVA
ncbi:hypothetical protein [Pseudovibrio sp. Ad37]|uniref:hypothetical protein n=1 Tax=Pseudovibrio sp. Ad37 TaxID=989422 RepID=UPI0007AECD37|nr:hypothetical protein [Pseudovibrio sp. Ad37]KZL24667.1 hypothetical protein PsAD37_02599 [Pseudovibrio sp. Ad37]